MARDFLSWLEDTWLEDAQDMLSRQEEFPASAGVIRSGEQPQVDSEYDKEDQDLIMVLDNCVNRLKEESRRLATKTPRAQKLKSMVDRFAAQWESALHDKDEKGGNNGLGYATGGDDETNWMKDNQPLPEPGKSPMAPPPAF